MWENRVSATSSGHLFPSLRSLLVVCCLCMACLVWSCFHLSTLLFLSYHSSLPFWYYLLYYSLHTSSITSFSLLFPSLLSSISLFYPITFFSLLFPSLLCSISLFYPILSFQLFSSIILYFLLFSPSFSWHL
jgi:hypothetical protein